MLIPVYIDGKEAGTVEIEKYDGQTVVEAAVRDVGRVLRLTVFGEKSFYLGVPVPEEDTLRLTRRLSPAEEGNFPEHPSYAAERPIETEAMKPAGRRHVLWQGGKPHYF